MKKNVFLILVMLFAIKANAQVIYSETFDNIPGPTSGGVGTYNFPANYILNNVDALVNDPGRTWFTEAWERVEDSDNLSDTCATSTSWYSPAGISNDFMWLPQIALPVGTSSLTWNAKSLTSGFEDAYEVRIMTITPTGGFNSIGNQISNSTVLFSTAAESITWVSHTVNLSAYGGQNIYIGFRNTSYDKDLLFIDDIKVEAIPPYDASVSAGLIEYTAIPFGQSIPLKGTIANVGGSALTNVSLKVDIYNSANVLLHSVTSTPVASILPLANATFTIPSYTPTTTGIYTIKYSHIQTEVDGNAANDELVKTTEIINNIYARDNGVVTSSVGIGANVGGYLGQSFTLSAPAYLYSISAFYTAGYLPNPGAGSSGKYGSAIWNTDVNGKPTSILAVTDTNYYPSTNPLFATSPIHGGTILLPAGTYAVTAIEFDSTLKLGVTDEIFTAGKHWAYWSSLPDWTTLESFGASFEKAFVLRMNVGATAFPLPTEALILQGKSSSNQHELKWTNQEKSGSQYEYVLQRSEDAKNWQDVYKESAAGRDAIRSLYYNDTTGSQEKSYYRVRVVNQDNELKYSNMITLFNSDNNVLVDLFPIPAKDVIHLNTNRYKNTVCNIYDIQGKLVLSQTIDQSNNTLSIQGLSSGTYTLKLSNANEIIFADKLIVQ